MDSVYATYLLDLAASEAELMGDRKSADHWRAKRDEIKAAVREKFYWNKEYGYAVDSRSAQGANAAMIYFKAAPQTEYPELIEAIQADIKRWNNHLSTGSRLTYPLFSVLSANGRIDEAVWMLTRKEYPGFLSMLDYADTMSEMWPLTNAPAVVAHCQLEGYSEIGKWFGDDLFGIRPDFNTPGFKHFFISPQLPQDLEFAHYEFETGYGPAKAAWKKTPAGTDYEIRIPPNASASVAFEVNKGQTIYEAGRKVEDGVFIKSEGRNEAGAAVYRLQPGVWQFEVR